MIIYWIGFRTAAKPPLRSIFTSIADVLSTTRYRVKNSLSCCLDLIENEVSNGLSAPLVTEYSREDGLYILINGWAMRWIIPLMRESDAYPTSILHFVKKILMQENCDSLNYLKIWKIFIKSLLPKGAKATEFRSIIDRIDNSSQRKLASIEKDMANLREELIYDYASNLIHQNYMKKSVQLISY